MSLSYRPWWLSAAIALAVGGCGRIAFEPLAVGPEPGGLLVAEPVYVASPAWNDYVRAAPGVDRYHQAGTPCDGSETGLAACVHAGELRAVQAPLLTSCTGSSARDALDAFVWICDDRTLPVTFYSAGFVPGRGLADLVDASGWKDNQVIVNGFAGEPARWWSNPVVLLPGNSGTAPMVGLAAAGTIYILDASRASNGYRLDADRIAIVTLPGATLRFADATQLNCASANGQDVCMIYVVDRRFVWIEGDLDARGGVPVDVGLKAETSAHFRIHRTRIAGPTDAGIFMIGAHNFRVTDVAIRGVQTGNGYFAPLSSDMEIDGLRAFDNGSYGIMITDVSGGTYDLRNLYASNNAADGVLFFNGGLGTATGVIATNNGGHGISFTSAGPVLSNVLSISNGGDGLHMAGGGGPTVFHALAALNTGSGIRMEQDGIGSVHQVVAMGNGNAGVELAGAASAPRVFSQLVTAKNGFAAIASTDAPAAFHRNLLVAGVCTVAGTGNGVDGTCAPAGSSTATLTSGVDLAASFVGAATGDAVNASDQAGTAAATAIVDWSEFENPFRTWTLLGGTSGRCATGTCQIWDWRLRATDLALVGTSLDGKTAAAPFAAGAPCPAAVAGDVTATSSYGGQTFLINASELAGDTIGDDDFLCESGEACVYSPNFGPYQGSGDPRAGGACLFQDGVVTGVTMYGFPRRAE